MKRPYIEMGKKAVKQIRLTLFTSEEIEKIEAENRKEAFIPVSLPVRVQTHRFHLSILF